MQNVIGSNQRFNSQLLTALNPYKNTHDQFVKEETPNSINSFKWLKDHKFLIAAGLLTTAALTTVLLMQKRSFITQSTNQSSPLDPNTKNLQAALYQQNLSQIFASKLPVDESIISPRFFTERTGNAIKEIYEKNEAIQEKNYNDTANEATINEIANWLSKLYKHPLFYHNTKKPGDPVHLIAARLHSRVSRYLNFTKKKRPFEQKPHPFTETLPFKSLPGHYSNLLSNFEFNPGLCRDMLVKRHFDLFEKTVFDKCDHLYRNLDNPLKPRLFSTLHSLCCIKHFSNPSELFNKIPRTDLNVCSNTF